MAEKILKSITFAGSADTYKIMANIPESGSSVLGELIQDKDHLKEFKLMKLIKISEHNYNQELILADGQVQGVWIQGILGQITTSNGDLHTVYIPPFYISWATAKSYKDPGNLGGSRIIAYDLNDNNKTLIGTASLQSDTSQHQFLQMYLSLSQPSSCGDYALTIPDGGAYSILCEIFYSTNINMPNRDISATGNNIKYIPFKVNSDNRLIDERGNFVEFNKVKGFQGNIVATRNESYFYFNHVNINKTSATLDRISAYICGRSNGSSGPEIVFAYATLNSQMRGEQCSLDVYSSPTAFYTIDVESSTLVIAYAN